MTLELELAHYANLAWISLASFTKFETASQCLGIYVSDAVFNRRKEVRVGLAEGGFRF